MLQGRMCQWASSGIDPRVMFAEGGMVDHGRMIYEWVASHTLCPLGWKVWREHLLRIA